MPNMSVYVGHERVNLQSPRIQFKMYTIIYAAAAAAWQRTSFDMFP